PEHTVATVDPVCARAATSLPRTGSLATRQGAGDDQALDLVRAFEDLHGLRLREIAFDREVAGVSRTAEDLYGVSGSWHRRVGRDAVGDRRLGAVAQVVVAPPRRGEVDRPRRLHGRGQIGQHESHALVVDDGLAELLALFGVLDGGVECGLSQPGRDRRDTEPPGVEGLESDAEARAFVAD